MLDNLNVWEIRDEDFSADMPPEDQLAFLCRYGILAPSAHNTQPWEVIIEGSELRVSVNPDRALKQGDPTSRETWLGIGCFVENIQLAASALGITIAKISHNYQDITRPIVTLTIGTAGAGAADRSLLRVITKRRSDRSRYVKRAVAEADAKQIEASWQTEGAIVRVTTDPEIIARVADLTARGMAMAFTQPEFREELASYIRPNWSKRLDGLHGYTMGLGTIASFFEPILARYGIGSGIHTRREAASLISAGALVLVFTKGDTPQFWLEAGMAYERAALEVTKLGLAQATVAAAVEAADFHLDIEQMMGTQYRLQTVMRIGYSQKQPPHSPRLPVEQIRAA